MKRKFPNPRTLIIFTGGPGTGKSGTAQRFLDYLGDDEIVKISYDQIKEKNWDIFGFDNEKQKDRLNWFSLEEFYLTIQKRMWENKTILIEYPFYQRHKPKLQELLDESGYDAVTICLYTDMETVYRRGFMFASLDGELTEIETKARGFIEIKTTEIHSAAALQKWDGHVPEYYYAQVLHYFVTLGWTFAWLKVQIKQTGRNEQTEFITRHYPFLRRALMEDMKFLYTREKEFWSYVERKQRPPLLLPPIYKE